MRPRRASASNGIVDKRVRLSHQTFILAGMAVLALWMAGSLVQELSLNRANSVKEAIVRKFSSLQPNQFATAGMGWDRPADPADPENHAKNRRVEIKVYPAEAPNK